MRSIYELALGEKFKLLHPRIQERFGFSSKDKRGSIGKGVMEKVWRGKFFTLPFLYVGSWRRIMFPEYGSDIPFTVRNYAYLDPFGRETVTWVRNFEARTPRRFDAYMIYSQQRGCIVDYLGTHEHLAVDIRLSVDDRGGLCLRSGEQRFYEGIVGFRFPMALSGVADVCEWFEDSDQKFHIEVNVHNDVWGRCSATRARSRQSGPRSRTDRFRQIRCPCGTSGGNEVSSHLELNRLRQKVTYF